MERPASLHEQILEALFAARCTVLQAAGAARPCWSWDLLAQGRRSVGIVKHANFEPATTYGGAHIVHLSKYLLETASLFQMRVAEAMYYAHLYLREMFPTFRREWIRAAHIWRARYSQPVVERHYSRLIPDQITPLRGLISGIDRTGLVGGSRHKLCDSRGKPGGGTCLQTRVPSRAGTRRGPYDTPQVASTSYSS